MKRINLYLIIFFLFLIQANCIYSKEKVRIITKNVKCPICNYEFEAHIIDNPDTFGGQDTDFLTRSLYSNPIANTIWTCPKCFFSAIPQDFIQKKVNLKTKLELKKIELSKELNSIKQDDIPSWIKYENAIAYYKAISADTVFLSMLHLKASWACRLESIEYTPKMEEISQKIFKELPLTANTSFETYYQKMIQIIENKLSLSSIPKTDYNYWKLIYADFLRQSGNHIKALEELKKLKLILSFYKENKAQIDKCIFLCESEKKYQLLAISFIEKQISENKINQEAKYNSFYLAGELSRRTGNIQAAKNWFKKTLEILPPEHPLYNLVQKQLQLIK